MAGVVEQIREVADALSEDGPDLTAVRVLMERIDNELLPHERADEALLVPLADRALGGSAATATLQQ